MDGRAKPPKGKADAKRSLAGKTPKDEGAKVRDLEKRLAEALKREAEALEQQTATAEILSVISNSPTDVQPVFEAIADSALALLGGWSALVLRFDGEFLHLEAARGGLPGSEQHQRARFPERLTSDMLSSRCILERAPQQDPDCMAHPNPAYRELARRRGFSAFVAVPMLRGPEAVGAILVTRVTAGTFAEPEVALLQTFADQAVIAIENARLFTKLQASNQDLRTALDTQTATSDILRVISRSQTNVQPVFDAIVKSAVRLLRARSGTLSRIVGDQIELAAHTSTDDAGDAATRAAFPQPLSFGGVHAQTIRHRVPLNVADAHTDPRLPEATHTYAQVRGYRSQGAVPMLRRDEAVGAIAVTRPEPGGFTDDEIALLQTFADQAVIAIENARLLSELQARTAELTQSVDQLTALGEVGQAVSSSLDVDTVLNTIVARAVQLSGTAGGIIYEYDETAETFHVRAAHQTEPEHLQALGATPIRLGEGALGRAAATRRPVEVEEILAEGAPVAPQVRNILARRGYRSLLAVPLLREDGILGGLVVWRLESGRFSADVVSLLQTFATQSALAIQNARLFREITDKSAQLEAASRHKSEFLANMSHELRTPLNAIIGFSEILAEKMFGDINEKQTEYLQDILESGRHLLSLINDILDLSKIEAGRMELELSDFDLPNALDNALTLVRERASRRGIRLSSTIDPRLGTIGGDERKVKQVLLNLLSNALKFTPEGGRIDVGARLDDEMAEVSVADTGIGIAPEDQVAVFEEFRQVGTADKKAEGTGLGLALSRKFIELHGGRILVTSQAGAGSTFTFTLPVRREE